MILARINSRVKYVCKGTFHQWRQNEQVFALKFPTDEASTKWNTELGEMILHLKRTSSKVLLIINSHNFFRNFKNQYLLIAHQFLHPLEEILKLKRLLMILIQYLHLSINLLFHLEMVILNFLYLPDLFLKMMVLL